MSSDSEGEFSPISFEVVLLKTFLVQKYSIENFISDIKKFYLTTQSKLRWGQSSDTAQEMVLENIRRGKEIVINILNVRQCLGHTKVYRVSNKMES